MERIAVFGGAFDPPHNGHLVTIGKLLNSGEFSKVIVVPSGDRPDKPERARAAERVHMVRLALDDGFLGDSRVELFTEQALGSVGYRTVDLHESLTTIYPHASLEFVIGSDLLAELPVWQEVPRLKKAITFLYLARPGVADFSFEERVREGFNVKKFEFEPESGVMVSSSSLREALGEGRSTVGLLPSVVREYIQLRRLYS